MQEKVENEPTQTVGVVAHSLRAVSKQQLQDLAGGAKVRGLPFHFHLEEQPKEIEDCQEFHGVTPMRLLLDNADVDERYTGVHCTHSRPDELLEYVDAGGMICICPLTEGNLGDGVPSLVSMGANICLGTDCNARIDMFEEMRWLEYVHRLDTGRRGACLLPPSDDGKPWEDRTARQLLRYATEQGAHSLGLSTVRM